MALAVVIGLHVLCPEVWRLAHDVCRASLRALYLMRVGLAITLLVFEVTYRRLARMYGYVAGALGDLIHVMTGILDAWIGSSLSLTELLRATIPVWMRRSPRKLRGLRCVFYILGEALRVVAVEISSWLRRGDEEGHRPWPPSRLLVTLWHECPMRRLGNHKEHHMGGVWGIV